jgi:hypothetical protein
MVARHHRPTARPPSYLYCVQNYDLLYRTLHDLGESPRTAFGGSASPNIAALAMQLDLDPIIKKIRIQSTPVSATRRG